LISQNIVGQRVIEIQMATVEFHNLGFSNGSLDGAGGGIYNAGGRLALERTWLFENTANTGGGLYNDGTATVRDSILYGNNGTLIGGGAIYNSPTATLQIVDTRVQSNQGASGAGIYNDGGSL